MKIKRTISDKVVAPDRANANKSGEVGWFEIWDKGFQRRRRRKNARKLPTDLMRALRGDLAKIADSPLPPEPDPGVKGPSEKEKMTKAGAGSSCNIHLARPRRRTKRADGTFTE